MNIFWNSVDPVYLTDSDRVFGETELAAIHTAVQSTVRNFMNLPPAVLETFIANKLNFHFEPAIRHYANMNARRGAPADMTANLKQAAALTITEMVASKAVLRTAERGLHMPIYKMKEYLTCFISKFITGFLVQQMEGSFPNELATHMAAASNAVTHKRQVIARKS